MLAGDAAGESREVHEKLSLCRRRFFTELELD